MSLPPSRSQSTAAKPDRDARQSAPGDDALAPRPLGDRLKLFLLLIVLPGLAVMAPVLVVTGIFGQRPKPRTTPATLTTAPLQASLDRSAQQLFPAPAPLSPEAIVVTARADHLAARMQTIIAQAQALGGSATEGLSTQSEKHLSVDLPAGRAEAFRQAIRNRTPADATSSSSPTPVASPGSPPAGGHDFVEVVIRTAADDE